MLKIMYLKYILKYCAIEINIFINISKYNEFSMVLCYKS